MIDLFPPKKVTKAAPGWLAELRAIAIDIWSGALPLSEVPGFIWYLITRPAGGNSHTD